MSEQGFTLVEVLIAFAILLLALGALLPVYSEMIDHAARAAEEGRATALAQTILDRVGADLPLADGRVDGESEGFGWHLVIRSHGTDDDQRNWPASAHEVEVTIAWRSAGRVQEERFQTLRLARKQSTP